MRCRRSSSTALIEILRCSSRGFCLHVVLWQPPYNFSQEIFAAIGLGLETDPRFFAALLALPRTPASRSRLGSRPFNRGYVLLGDSIATVAHRFVHDTLDKIPVLLVVDLPHLQGIRPRECGSMPSSTRPAFGVYDDAIEDGSGTPWKTYADILVLSLYRNETVAHSNATLLISSLLPLVYPQLVRVLRACQIVQTSLFQGEMGKAIQSKAVGRKNTFLDQNRFQLRRAIEYLEDNLDYMLRFVHSQPGKTVRRNRPTCVQRQTTEMYSTRRVD